MAIIVRESGTGKVINVSQDIRGGRSLLGQKLTTSQAKKISGGEYTVTQSGIKIKTDKGGVTIFQKTPLSSPTIKTSTSKTSSVSMKPVSIKAYGVYDTKTETSRALTSFETIGISKMLEGQRKSFAPRISPPNPKSFEQTRSDLLKDPKVERVYIGSKGDDPRIAIVGVEEKPIIQKPKDEFEGLYGATTYSAGKKRNLFDKAKGFGIDLKKGLLYERDPLGRDPRYSATTAYNIGNVLGVASFNVGIYERGGARAANILFKSPRIWKGTTTALKVLDKPIFRQGGRLAMGTYGALVGGQMLTAKDSPEAARIGLRGARTLAVLGGAGSGFKSQIASNVKAYTSRPVLFPRSPKSYKPPIPKSTPRKEVINFKSLLSRSEIKLTQKPYKFEGYLISRNRGFVEQFRFGDYKPLGQSNFMDKLGGKSSRKMRRLSKVEIRKRNVAQIVGGQTRGQKIEEGWMLSKRVRGPRYKEVFQARQTKQFDFLPSGKTRTFRGRDKILVKKGKKVINILAVDKALKFPKKSGYRMIRGLPVKKGSVADPFKSSTGSLHTILKTKSKLMMKAPKNIFKSEPSLKVKGVGGRTRTKFFKTADVVMKDLRPSRTYQVQDYKLKELYDTGETAVVKGWRRGTITRGLVDLEGLKLFRSVTRTTSVGSLSATRFKPVDSLIGGLPKLRFKIMPPKVLSGQRQRSVSLVDIDSKSLLGSRTSFGLQSVYAGGSSLFDIKTESKTRTKTKVGVAQKLAPLLMSRQAVASGFGGGRSRNIFKTPKRPTPKRPIPSENFFKTSPFTPIPPRPRPIDKPFTPRKDKPFPIKPPVFGFEIPLPKKSPRRKKKARVSKKGVDFVDVYAPSIEANLFNIKSEKIPEEFKIKSGLFVRPIIKTGRRLI